MAGIVLEQHPDRARLFMQWKQMDWPIAVDALNRLGLTAVPITLLIDEAGVVRQINPTREEVAAFVNAPRASDAPASGLPVPGPDLPRPGHTDAVDDPATLRGMGDLLFLWGGPERLDEAMSAWHRALALNPDDGSLHFRLGVAFRRRYDSADRQPGDFARAVREWGAALDLDPNQYIWRRRIQQYGPRLRKPYPFYDWVPAARQAIRARGETPLSLAVEPGGAEFAAPLREFRAGAPVADPDPEGRITRDEFPLIRAEATVVPWRATPGGAVRIHLVLRPNPVAQAHWNNEAEELQLWIEPPPGWSADRRLLTHPNPPTAVSREPRKLEFELQVPASFASTAAILRAHALYYVCKERDGTCLYRRQDIPIRVPVEPRK